MSWLMFLSVLLLFLLCTSILIGDSLTNKEEQALVPEEPDASIKCGSCPCINPCAMLPPPPPPPPLPPPPSTVVTYCPPLPPPPPGFIYFTDISPPPPRFVYVTGVPGNVYVTDPYDSGFYDGARQNGVSKKLLLFIGFGVLGLMVI